MNACGWPASRAIAPVALAVAIATAAAGLSAAGNEPVLGLPKAGGPYRLCAIPYDAAQNPGSIFSRVLS
jgi:hypothetical protein